MEYMLIGEDMNEENNNVKIDNYFDPIQDPSQDRLGRANFSENIANCIFNYRQCKPLVIGIYGPWGFGKTSVLNMVKSYLRQLDKDRKLALIDFNPWMYSHTESLIEEFLLKISIELTNQDFKKEANKFKEIADTFEWLSSNVSTFSAKAGLVFRLLAKPLIKAANKYNKPLWQIKGELADILAPENDNGNNKKIIIIIDDIDRLTLEEIRKLFQAVKTIMDLPNVIFIISMDHLAVSRMLETPGFPGCDFIEKIVQIPIKIPLPDAVKLESCIFAEMDRIAKIFSENQWDSERWGSVYRGALRNILLQFGNLRKVYRFMSQILININKVRMEINPVDYIAIESIKLFYPELYESIYQNKIIILGREANIGELAYEKLLLKHPVGPFKELLGKYNHNVKSLLNHLFPNLEHELKGEENYGGTNSKWQMERRICSRYHFDNYFIQDLASNKISQNIFDDIIAKRHSIDEYISIMQAIDKRDLFEEFLLRLDELSNRVNWSCIVDLSKALINYSDNISPKKTVFLTTMDHVIADLVLKLFAQSNLADCFEQFYQTLAQSDSLYMPVFITARMEYQLQKGELLLLKIEPDNLESLKRMCVDKILRTFKAKNLSETKGLRVILDSWKNWDANNYTELFVETDLKDEQLLILLDEYEYQDEMKLKRFNVDAYKKIADINKTYNRVIGISNRTRDDRIKEICDAFIRSYNEYNRPGFR